MCGGVTCKMTYTYLSTLYTYSLPLLRCDLPMRYFTYTTPMSHTAYTNCTLYKRNIHMQPIVQKINPFEVYAHKGYRIHSSFSPHVPLLLLYSDPRYNTWGCVSCGEKNSHSLIQYPQMHTKCSAQYVYTCMTIDWS